MDKFVEIKDDRIFCDSLKIFLSKNNFQLQRSANNVDLLLMEMMLKTQMVGCFANDDGCVIQALGKLNTFFI